MLLKYAAQDPETIQRERERATRADDREDDREDDRIVDAADYLLSPVYGTLQDTWEDYGTINL